MKIPKITSVVPTGDYLLLVTFSDGVKKMYDASRLLDIEMFASLKNEAFFRNVSVEPGGYAISWNSEIDVSEFELWQRGQILS